MNEKNKLDTEDAYLRAAINGYSAYAQAQLNFIVSRTAKLYVSRKSCRKYLDKVNKAIDAEENRASND